MFYEPFPRPVRTVSADALTFAHRVGATAFVFDDWRERIAQAVDNLIAAKIEDALTDVQGMRFWKTP